MADELTATDRLYLPKLKALLTVWLRTQRDIVRGSPAGSCTADVQDSRRLAIQDSSNRGI